MSYEKLKNRINFTLLLIISLAAITLIKVFDTPTTKFEKTISNANTRFYQVKIRSLKINALLARTPAERQRGLSGQPNLPQLSGILFVFDRDLRPSFWMKEVNFPIDIIWIDRNLQVVGIAPNISPDTFPQTFTAPRPVRYVLEINAGLTSEFSIRPGDMIIPALQP